MKNILHAARASLVLLLLSLSITKVGAQTYCTPTIASPYNNWIVDFVTTGGITNIDNPTDNTVYTDYSATQIVTAVQGTSIDFQANAYSGGSSTYARVWVDWNQDGDFDDAGEMVYDLTSGGGSYVFSGTIEVPITAAVGTTRMRIRSDWYSATGSGYELPTPCGTTGWGEAEDYAFTVIASEPCEGTITAGTVAGVDSICGNVSFTLSATGSTMAGGMITGWQKSNSATGPWVDAGSSGISLNVSAGITTATYYRYYATCTASGSSDTTDVHLVEVKPGSECYCTPSAGGSSTYGCSDWRIDNFVTTGGVSNISNLNSNCAGSSMYGNYTSMLASQYRGSTVNFVIKLEYPWGTSTGNVKMWIDWDQSGSFDADEVVYSNMEAPANTDLTGIIIVPDDAVEGVTRIRIKTTNYNDFSDASACTIGAWDYTEVEDYSFEVFIPDPCTSVAMTPVSIEGPESVCADAESYTLSVTGIPIASGLTKVWEQRAPAGSGAWTVIAGETGPILNVPSISEETEYRFTVTCEETGESETTTWIVALNPPTECYCTPVFWGCTWNQITGFETSDATIDISNLDNGCGGSDGSAEGGYSDFTDMGATAFQGTIVNYTIGLSSSWMSARMWIDWNQNGFFEDDEIVYDPPYDDYSPSTITGSFEVPFDAVPGTTGLRIRGWTDWGSTWYGACSDHPWNDGETEDYTFTVVVPPSCDEVPFTGLSISGPENICAGYAFTIASSGTPVASGVTRIWQSKTEGGAWTTIEGVTSLTYNVSEGIFEATEFRYINICTLNGKSDTSNVLSISINPPLECYCEAVFRYAYDMSMGWAEYKIKDVYINGDNDTLKSLNTPFTFTGDFGDYGGYTDYTGDTATIGLPDLTQTGVYTGQVKLRLPWEEQALRVWIDYNDDGLFDPSETIYASVTSWPALSSATPADFSFSIPADAAPGVHRMRVRTVTVWEDIWDGIDPCELYDYGQTQDYLVLVKELMPCSEVAFPTSVTAYASPPNVCGTGNVNLRLGQNMPLADGITYQWKSSSSEDGTYTNVGPLLTALEGPATTISDVSEDTYFRCYVLCEGEPVVISDAIFVQSVNLSDVSISMEDGQTCGPGSVTLSGSTTDGSIFWYEEPEGGSPIFMGNEFTTPELTTTKTYFATGGAYGASDGIVGTGSSTSSMWDFGLFAPYGGAKAMQYMYTKADLNEAGINMGGDIESIAFNLAAMPDVPLTEYTIKIKTVTTGPPMEWQTSDWTTVYGPATFNPTATGWQVFPFSTPFEWNGIDNIILEICFKTPDLGSVWTGASGTHKYTAKPGQGQHYVTWSTTDDPCSSSWGEPYYANALPNARFYIPGCETERVPVTAHVRPVPAPVNIGADETVCKDPQGGLTLNVGPLPESYTRLWNTGESTQTIRITESGVYSITVANEFGCEVYDTVSKVLLEIPVVNLGDDMKVCQGGYITLDAGPDGLYYMWNTGATSQTYNAYSEGTYSVLVENVNGCIALDTITLTFEGHMPEIGSIITTNTDPYTFSFEPILANEYVIGYLWDFGDGSEPKTEVLPSHTYVSPGTYTVTLTVFSSCGERTYTTTTHILSANNASIDDNAVALYPNPAKDLAIIDAKGNLSMKSVTVTNVLGQVMYQGVADTETKHQIDLSGYASGLYTVRIETDKGFIIRKFEIVK
jgi:PKD repeat protein